MNNRVYRSEIRIQIIILILSELVRSPKIGQVLLSEGLQKFRESLKWSETIIQSQLPSNDLFLLTYWYDYHYQITILKTGENSQEMQQNSCSTPDHVTGRDSLLHFYISTLHRHRISRLSMGWTPCRHSRNAIEKRKTRRSRELNGARFFVAFIYFDKRNLKLSSSACFDKVLKSTLEAVDGQNAVSETEKCNKKPGRKVRLNHVTRTRGLIERCISSHRLRAGNEKRMSIE